VTETKRRHAHILASAQGEAVKNHENFPVVIMVFPHL
jgi:hypothetical protein